MKALWIQLFIAFILGYLLVEWALSALDKQLAKKHPNKVWKETWFWPPLAALLHAGMVYLLTQAWALWWLPLTVFAFHLFTGYVLQKGKQDNLLPFNITLQCVLIFLRIILFFSLSSLGYAAPLWLNTFPTISSTVLILLLALILLLPLGGRFIGSVMTPFHTEKEKYRDLKNATHRASLPATQPKAGLLQTIGQQLFGNQSEAIPPAQEQPTLLLQNGFENGGRVIGYLERLLIFVFIATGQYAGIGFLVAAKSIFRFGEFKDSENRMEAEYIIIGTFLSFLYAIVVSLMIVWLLR
ncbi:MAG: hypothetical protein VB013_06070 [Anaerolineaceae bacterium]|nr:hypothetical protein [Anaerolineaceae bacterium]